MKSSSKVLLFGVLSALLLIAACLYTHLEEFTADATAQLIEVSSSAEIEPKESLPPLAPAPKEHKLIEQSTTPIPKPKPKEETNQSDDSLMVDAKLFYQIIEHNITIDGRLPIMEDSDILKQRMMKECSTLHCNKQVRFSPQEREPEWKELAIALIQLFHEEGLSEAMFEAERKKITIEAVFKSEASKLRLDQLLEGYDALFDIQDSSLVKVPENRVALVTTPEENKSITSNQSLEVAAAMLAEDAIEQNQTTPITLAQAKVSEILKKRPINFHRNRARITRKGRATLREIIAILEPLKDEIEIEVQGYTDAGGKAKVNLWISQQRAKSVKWYLGHHGLDPKKITAKGFGETNLLLEDQPYNIRNRRVEIVIKKEKK